MEPILVSGSFDDLRFAPACGCSRRRPGWARSTCCSGPTRSVERLQGRAPKFPQAERRYFLEAIRYVDRVTLCRSVRRPTRCRLARLLGRQRWVVDAASRHAANRRPIAAARDPHYRVLAQRRTWPGFPDDPTRCRDRRPPAQDG